MHRKADLRLDTKEGRCGRRTPVIVPGKSGESELILRVTSDDPDEVMPPPKSNRKSQPQQIELLQALDRRGGGVGQALGVRSRRSGRSRRHVKRHVLADETRSTASSSRGWSRKGCAPRPSAAKETLIRRVTLDLTGLPPTPEEVDAFLADASPDAYETVVDRLLASPRYGERMVWDWLDAARYADTNGYQGDPTRAMWYWRDWVIDALNRNMPFDQFTIEQLAGDLLPEPDARRS